MAGIAPPPYSAQRNSVVDADRVPAQTRTTFTEQTLGDGLSSGSPSDSSNSPNGPSLPRAARSASIMSINQLAPLSPSGSSAFASGSSASLPQSQQAFIEEPTPQEPNSESCTLHGATIGPKIKDCLDLVDEIHELQKKCMSMNLAKNVRAELQKRNMGLLLTMVTKLIMDTHSTGANTLREQLRQLRALERFASASQANVDDELMLQRMWQAAGNVVAEVQSQLIQHWRDVGVQDIQIAVEFVMNQLHITPSHITQ